MYNPMTMVFRPVRESLVFITVVIPFVGSTSYRQCGGVLSGNGSIRTPNFSFNYPNNCYCTWTLKTDHEKTEIALQIRNMSTEAKYDYVYIVDALGNELWLSGSHRTQDFIFLAPTRVTFLTDQSVTSSGFEIYFSTILKSPGKSTDNVYLSTKTKDYQHNKDSPTMSPNFRDFQCPEAESGNDSSTFEVSGTGVIYNNSNALLSIERSQRLSKCALKRVQEITLRIDSYEFKFKASVLMERHGNKKAMVETKNCTGDIWGAVIGTLVLVTAVTVIAMIVRRRSQSKSKSTAQVDGTIEHGNGEIAMEDNPIYG